VAGLVDKEVARVQAGEWAARIADLPTGGPYRIELALAGEGGEQVAAVDYVLVGDLWILAGQSNMVGRAELKDVEQPDELVHVLKPKSGDWDLAKEPIHERVERNDMVIGAGLGLPFAKELVRRTAAPIGLIPTAVGGTSLWQWDPALKTKGRESLYGNMLLQFEAAGGHVRGMLWHQGEADAQPDRLWPRFRWKMGPGRGGSARPKGNFTSARLGFRPAQHAPSLAVPEFSGCDEDQVDNLTHAEEPQCEKPNQARPCLADVETVYSKESQCQA